MAGRLPIPDSCWLDPAETDLRKICDAINNISQRAFAPVVEYAEGDTNWQSITASTSALITGVEVDIVVPVRSYARVHYVVYANCQAYAAGEPLLSAIYKDNSGQTSSTIAWQPAASGEGDTITGVWYDSSILQPETLYNYELRAWVSGYSASTWRVYRQRCHILVITEPEPRV